MTIAQLNNLNIPNISVQQSGQWYLEITSDNKTKADAVQSILDNKNLDFQEIAAIGDGHNDIPLLQSAGLAIAVLNTIVRFVELKYWGCLDYLVELEVVRVLENQRQSSLFYIFLIDHQRF